LAVNIFVYRDDFKNIMYIIVKTNSTTLKKGTEKQAPLKKGTDG